jgi:hypothetical protein
MESPTSFSVLETEVVLVNQPDRVSLPVAFEVANHSVMADVILMQDLSVNASASVATECDAPFVVRNLSFFYQRIEYERQRPQMNYDLRKHPDRLTKENPIPDLQYKSQKIPNYRNRVNI